MTETEASTEVPIPYKGKPYKDWKSGCLAFWVVYARSGHSQVTTVPPDVEKYFLVSARSEAEPERVVCAHKLSKGCSQFMIVDGPFTTRKKTSQVVLVCDAQGNIIWPAKRAETGNLFDTTIGGEKDD